MPVEWARVIATLMTPLVTILIAAGTAWWTVKTWRDDREKQREEERDRLATLYINPFLIACEGLQSRLYNILDKAGLVPLKEGYPGGDYAQEILYFIVQFFGWQQIIYRYYYDREVIRLLEELRGIFATDDREYGGHIFCFFRSQQRAFGDMIMSRTEGPFGSEFVTEDYNQYLRMLKSDSFAGSKSVTVTLATLRRAAEDPRGLRGTPEGRKRLVRIQHLLVDLLNHFETEKGISYFTKKGGRKKARD